VVGGQRNVHLPCYFITSQKHEMKILTLPAIYASLKAFLIKVNFLDASDTDATWSVKADLAFRSFMFRKCNVPENQVTIPRHLGEVHPVILATEEWEYLDHLEVEEADDAAEAAQEDPVEETVEDTVEPESAVVETVTPQGAQEEQTQDQSQPQSQSQVQEPEVATDNAGSDTPEPVGTAEEQVPQDSDKGE